MHPALLIDTSGLISSLNFDFLALLMAAVMVIGIEALVLWSLQRDTLKKSLLHAFQANAASGICVLIIYCIAKPAHVLDLIFKPAFVGFPGLVFLTLIMESSVLLLLRRKQPIRKTLLAALSMNTFSSLIVAIPVAIPFMEFLIVRSEMGLLAALLLLLLSITALETIALILLKRGGPFGAIVLDSFLANSAALLGIAGAWSLLSNLAAQQIQPLASTESIIWIAGLMILLSAQTAVLTLRRRDQIMRRVLQAALVTNALTYSLIIAPLMQMTLTM